MAFKAQPNGFQIEASVELCSPTGGDGSHSFDNSKLT